MPNYVLSEQLYKELQDLIKWKKSFLVTGAREFVNKPESCTIAIGTDPNKPTTQFPAVRWVKVVQNGGVAGSDSTDCTFTYDIYHLLDTGATVKLNQGGVVDPVGPIPVSRVAYTAGTQGITFQDTNGAWHLFVVNEEPQREAC